ncbi:Lrp/AsnC family transcriptional regulator [Aurantiacibacter marinus]|uniref:Transcriptional regulator n=1 Tax=Aurantiacibacter marinus TaxID=874156 RepID=A0A0H0XLI6_9SPHN|nr:Lrp/AsnC family transcriptional regulator [Aurantiacibacter marinus]KLI62851.1 transcriptional regulator [Aurantiacibacter marinus]
MIDKLKLDSIDWAILGQLQRDASQTVQAIGDQVGLSSNPCWRRIKRMEDAGVIAKRVALLDPHAVGLATTVFVAIRINRHDSGWLETFAAAINALDEVIECHRMAGDIDYMLKLRVRDIADYDRIYQRLIGRVAGLSDVTASFSMEEMKFTTALPRPD